MHTHTHTHTHTLSKSIVFVALLDFQNNTNIDITMHHCYQHNATLRIVSLEANEWMLKKKCYVDFEIVDLTDFLETNQKFKEWKQVIEKLENPWFAVNDSKSMVSLFKHMNLRSKNVKIDNSNEYPWNVKAPNNMFDKVTELNMTCTKECNYANLILFLSMNSNNQQILFKNVIKLSIDHNLFYGEYNETKPQINLFSIFPSLKHLSLSLYNARTWHKTEPILIPETVQSFEIDQLYLENARTAESRTGVSENIDNCIPFFDCLPMTFNNIKQSQMQNMTIDFNSYYIKYNELNQNRWMVEILNLCNQFPDFKCLKLYFTKMNFTSDMKSLIEWLKSLNKCQIKLDEWTHCENSKQIIFHFDDSIVHPDLTIITQNEFKCGINEIETVFHTYLFPKCNLKLKFHHSRF